MSVPRCPVAGLVVLGGLVLLTGCASIPDGAYFPSPTHPDTLKVAHALARAAAGAGDDPARYSFALVASPQIRAWSGENAIVYVSDGLARQPSHVVEPLIAHEVAHEILGHAGTKRALSLSMTAGFTILGVMAPGVGLADLLVTPLVVRAFSRTQELDADARAVEILRAIGYRAPRRALWYALQVAEARNGNAGERGGVLATHPPMAKRLAALKPLERPAAPGPEDLWSH
jgi:Zn-dependent protease with chaperone function